MNIKLITFGSHDNYIKAGERLITQSKKLNIFTESLLYTKDYLMKDNDFWNKHNNFITNNKRGYGYWLWKPYIIKKTMENMNEGDILLYLDCGCEVSYNKINELLECIDIVKKDKIVGSHNRNHLEIKWNKMDCIHNINNSININDIQREAGALMFLICNETKQLVNEWYTLCCDYHNIDDTPSILQNCNEFIEHRHDQSVYSLLTKKYNVYSNYDIKNAIYYIRNKTEISHI
jgi:TusA-related sulfurtransferase